MRKIRTRGNMKRLIKYHSPYNETKFCNCSTEYEVLPYITDSANPALELLELASSLGMEIDGKVINPQEGTNDLMITHAIKLKEQIVREYSTKTEDLYTLNMYPDKKHYQMFIDKCLF